MESEAPGFVSNYDKISLLSSASDPQHSSKIETNCRQESHHSSPVSDARNQRSSSSRGGRNLQSSASEKGGKKCSQEDVDDDDDDLAVTSQVDESKLDTCNRITNDDGNDTQSVRLKNNSGLDGEDAKVRAEALENGMLAHHVGWVGGDLIFKCMVSPQLPLNAVTDSCLDGPGGGLILTSSETNQAHSHSSESNQAHHPSHSNATHPQPWALTLAKEGRGQQEIRKKRRLRIDLKDFGKTVKLGRLIIDKSRRKPSNVITSSFSSPPSANIMNRNSIILNKLEEAIHKEVEGTITVGKMLGVNFRDKENDFSKIIRDKEWMEQSLKHDAKGAATKP